MTLEVLVFAVVYFGMILGRIPFLAMDRTGVALLGAIVLAASGTTPPAEAWRAVDVPTLGLLFGLMVVSAKFRLSGFYDAVTRRVAAAPYSPAILLALVMGVAGGLSALLTNDIICLAMTPLLAEGCMRRGLNPVPYLLGLACSANIGSAATLIGNPQNMLIGQALSLSFAGYLFEALPVAVAGLGAAWAVIAFLYRRRWLLTESLPGVDSAQTALLDKGQTAKGAAALLAVVAVFLFTSFPREQAALAAAGFILLSKRLNTRAILKRVDWHLLMLFIGLFVVNHAFAACGALNQLMDALARTGCDASAPGPLFALTVLLSNLVSNVPATMLLLPVATHPAAGPILALASTLAGNLFIVGSIANIIVIEQGNMLGICIGWREHARTGVPVTLLTLGIAAAWIAVRF